MKIRGLLFLTPVLFCLQSSAQPVQCGPYTVHTLSDGVYRIEDANNRNPAGVHGPTDPSPGATNNCSDMYLITGRDKALLIDLSNAVRWDSTATVALRSLIKDLCGKRELHITLTHRHGDHLGMLPAFRDDPAAFFWVPAAEFEGMDLFPRDRTKHFPENDSIDLGGNYVIHSMELPGHTSHSTIFFIKKQNLLFTGDAIGSGNGVWLFDEASFTPYVKSVDRLITCISNPSNGLDPVRLVIYGGHYWQKPRKDDLGFNYLLDMRALIKKIASGEANTISVSYSFVPFLDTNFSYGTATITWNREAALRYAKEMKRTY